VSRSRPERVKTAPEKRADAKTRAKQAIRAEMSERQLFPADLAAQLGIDPRQLERRLDVQTDARHPSIADLLLLDDETLIGVLARLLVDRPITIVAVPDSPDVDDELLEHHEAASAAMREHLQAAADRHLTPAEGAALRAAALREAAIAIRIARVAQSACDTAGGVALKGRAH
jgi:AraC-like DNA-binding protein